MRTYPVATDSNFELFASYNVQRGAAWLDENKPGWESKMDLENFYMSDGSRCVAGQVFREEAGEDESGYDLLMDKHGSHFVMEHGFVSSEHRNDWVQQINARLLVHEKSLVAA